MGSTGTTDYGPYLSRVKRLTEAYPALIQLFDKLAEFDDDGRQVVESTYQNGYGRSPGRCAVLEFGGEEEVTNQVFDLPHELLMHFQKLKADNHNSAGACRLYVLEDLRPDFIEILGDNLGVDPYVFAEQTDAWYFTDIQSIAHRQVVSLNRPEKSFTVRYHELRKPSLQRDDAISVLRNQQTFAVNRRLYEPSVVVESPSMPTEDSVALVRRCASFWTDQEQDAPSDAILLVDPPMNVSRFRKREVKGIKSGSQHLDYIFQDQEYGSRGELWSSEGKGPEAKFKLQKVPYSSEPYHRGCTTSHPLSLASQESRKAADAIANAVNRDVTSPFDETLFYWRTLATKQQIRRARLSSVQSADHLLKFVGYHWIHALELISHTLAQSEYFNDDNPATRPKYMSTADWRQEFYKVVKASHKINYFRRKMIYFESNMKLNLERLGTSIDRDIQSGTLADVPQAIIGAQRDFKVIASRLSPLRERANNLSNVANDIASFRAAFQSIEDSSSGLSLSILATVIFPFTLVASILSMGDSFLPGQGQFWMFFAISVPLTTLIVLFTVANQNWHYWRERAFQLVQTATSKTNKPSQRKEMLTSV